jgi:hypothetical protein
MSNELIFIIHTLITIFFCLGALRLGKHALIATLCLLGVLSNVFIAKQIMLFGFAVTCSDVYAVGGILCLNLLQEFCGREIITRTIWTSFFCLLVFLVMSQLHLWYIPNGFDTAQEHYGALFGIMPRIACASIVSYITVQFVDARIFSLLQRLLLGKFFTVRTIISLVVSQALDTVLFSFLGLYGIVGSVWQIIFVSLVVKLMVIGVSAPLIGVTKYVLNRRTG